MIHTGVAQLLHGWSNSGRASQSQKLAWRDWLGSVSCILVRREVRGSPSAVVASAERGADTRRAPGWYLVKSAV